MKNYDVNSKKWTKFKARYQDLRISKAALELLIADPKKFKGYCNGVGSTRGFSGRLTYHFIPNTIWFMSITPASDLHDVDYSIPDEFDTIEHALEYKKEADNRMLQNMNLLIDRRGGMFQRLRELRAFEYYGVLRTCGTDSFLSDKIILNNLKY